MDTNRRINVRMKAGMVLHKHVVCQQIHVELFFSGKLYQLVLQRQKQKAVQCSESDPDPDHTYVTVVLFKLVEPCHELLCCSLGDCICRCAECVTAIAIPFEPLVCLRFFGSFDSPICKRAISSTVLQLKYVPVFWQVLGQEQAV